MHYAVCKNTYLVKKLLKEYGVNVDKKNNKGNTALHCFFESVNIEKSSKILTLILAHWSCNLNSLNNKNENVLHIAVKFSWALDYIATLVKKVDVNAKNICGNTPLHCAIINKNIKSVRILLKTKDIDVNIQNNEGNTPLHLAIKYNLNDGLIELLIDSGANIYITNKQEKFPLEVKFEYDASLICNLTKPQIIICKLKKYIDKGRYCKATSLLKNQFSDLQDAVFSKKTALFSLDKFNMMLRYGFIKSFENYINDDKSFEDVVWWIDRGCEIHKNLPEDRFNCLALILITDCDFNKKEKIINYMAEKQPENFLNALHKHYVAPPNFNQEDVSKNTLEYIENNDQKLYGYFEKKYFLNWSYGMDLGFKPLISKYCLSTN